MNEVSNIRSGHRKKHHRRRSSTSSLSSSSSDIDIASYNAFIMTQNYMLEQEIHKKLQEYFYKYNKYKNMPVERVSKKVDEKPVKVVSNTDLLSSDSPYYPSYFLLENKLESIIDIISTDTNLQQSYDCIAQKKYTDNIYSDFINIYNNVGDEYAIEIIKDKLPIFIQSLLDGYINGCLWVEEIQHICDQNKQYSKLNEFIKDYLIQRINKEIPQILNEHMQKEIQEEIHDENSIECKTAEAIIDEYIGTIEELLPFYNILLGEEYNVIIQNLEKIKKFKDNHFIVSM